MLHDSDFTSLENPDLNADWQDHHLQERELTGDLVFDHDSLVSDRLGGLDLDPVPPQFVESCAPALQTDQKLLNAEITVQEI
ncbi:hypothetical protein M413DRAFT_438937 [Hebeloma cylindrosporum]|uniref:Uncharacterized protein n=1 Tax=Hebeloma cylindrosporum TaxID=76867 RepID=A0A0C2YJ65_HEBCY|nr:hypothetical protein M413DRAFT_438937 [Hebeloma cylindrosporum h7]